MLRLTNMEIATIFAKGYLKLVFYLFLLLSIKYGQRKSIILRSFLNSKNSIPNTTS